MSVGGDLLLNFPLFMAKALPRSPHTQPRCSPAHGRGLASPSPPPNPQATELLRAIGCRSHGRTGATASLQEPDRRWSLCRRCGTPQRRAQGPPLRIPRLLGYVRPPPPPRAPGPGRPKPGHCVRPAPPCPRPPEAWGLSERRGRHRRMRRNSLLVGEGGVMPRADDQRRVMAQCRGRGGACGAVVRGAAGHRVADC